jgi:hypothetical protein
LIQIRRAWRLPLLLLLLLVLPLCFPNPGFG